ncbi:BMP family lipoprotein [Streptomyces yerevanensis]|uniref:BMP family lipoprotein n=1 Tax=Streptomyces yerevanensis TaxID=66378 RepID=UPI000A84083C|nr:BMP family ABC transporter substrate-binding protein [Streptomyces yerevanensis]
MRRISKLTRVAVGVASLALAATACGGTSSEAGSGSEGEGESKKGLAIAYDIGGKGDQSFNDAAFSGLDKAKKEFKYDTADIEPTDGETDADKVQRLTSAAAKATKTNTVGFVGGVDIPLIHKFEAGYKQGVTDTNPKVKVLSQYLTQTAEEGGFASPDKGKAAAESQLENNADVVYQAAGLSGQGVIEAAATQKKWAIGVDSDQYEQEALAKFKDYILTSALKDVGGAVYALAKSVEDGKPLTGVQTFDLKVDGVGLAETNPEYAKIAGLKDAVDKAKAGIIDGSIKVKTE